VLDAAAGLSITALSCVWTLTGALDILLLIPGVVFDEASLRWILLFLPLHNHVRITVQCQQGKRVVANLMHGETRILRTFSTVPS